MSYRQAFSRADETETEKLHLDVAEQALEGRERLFNVDVSSPSA